MALGLKLVIPSSPRSKDCGCCYHRVEDWRWGAWTLAGPLPDRGLGRQRHLLFVFEVSLSYQDDGNKINLFDSVKAPNL
jgi:hypothetical protein